MAGMNPRGSRGLCRPDMAAMPAAERRRHTPPVLPVQQLPPAWCRRCCLRTAVHLRGARLPPGSG
eukprot:56151-Eustigmatos_ZCMA.PRE.1